MTYSQDQPVRNQTQKFKAQGRRTFSISKTIKLSSSSSSSPRHFNQHLQCTKQQITATFPILKISRSQETACQCVWTIRHKMILLISARWTYHYHSNLHLIHSLLHKSDQRKYNSKHIPRSLLFLFLTVLQFHTEPDGLTARTNANHDAIIAAIAADDGYDGSALILIQLDDVAVAITA